MKCVSKRSKRSWLSYDKSALLGPTLTQYEYMTTRGWRRWWVASPIRLRRCRIFFGVTAFTKANVASAFALLSKSIYFPYSHSTTIVALHILVCRSAPSLNHRLGISLIYENRVSLSSFNIAQNILSAQFLPGTSSEHNKMHKTILGVPPRLQI